MASTGFLQVGVTGADAVAALFRALPDDLQQRSMQASLFAASAAIQDAVRAAAPVGLEPTRKTRTVRSIYRGKGQDRRKMILLKPLAIAYDYGHLRANIVRRRGRGGKGVAVGVGSAFWGNILERGSVRMRPHPFFFRAVEGARSAFLQRLGAELEKNVAAATIRLGGQRSAG